MIKNVTNSYQRQTLKSKLAQSFNTAYEQLNREQKKAVDAIEGPVLVVAGPGTGKTQVLTMRIANILRQTDIKPSNILALTFTESAAQNMRLRLTSLIGPDAYYVQISTFHSFCDQLITNHIEYFPLNPASQPISDLERFELLRSIVEELPLEAIKPLNAPLFHVRSLMNNIASYKREGVTAETLRLLVEAQWQDPEDITSRTERLKIAKRQQQLLEQINVYEAYQQRLRKAGRYDFEDMLSLTAEVFSREEVLLQEYQEQYMYLLIDEYQDTNTVQNQVTRLLASYWGEQANIFVVGDPHQSIYRFQGASLENIIQFIGWYPQARIVTLTEGYRCPSQIYDVSHELIMHGDTLQSLSELGPSGVLLQKSLQSCLTSANNPPNSIVVTKAADQNTELVSVVEEIKKLLATGTLPNEIAILYTKNSYAAEIIPLLDYWQIPYFLEGGVDALTLPIVQQFVTLCEVIITIRQGDDPSIQLFELCTYPWISIDRKTLFQLSRLASKEHRTLFDIAQSPIPNFSRATPELIETKELEKIQILLEKLEQWGAADFQDVFTNWLSVVVAESGLHQYLVDQAEAFLEPLLAIYSLFGFVKQLNQSNQNFHLMDFVRAMSTLREQKVSIPLQTLTNTDQRVRLSTVHKAKGQEWQYVFILHLLDGVWGNRRLPIALPMPENIITSASALARQTKEQQNQDDRRLLYVAITRAKIRAVLSHAIQSNHDGLIRPQVPSIYLSELDHRNDLKRIDAAIAISPIQRASIQIGPRSSAQADDRLQQYLLHLTTDFSLSITALNNYLADPVKFLYQNLLALPSAKLPHLAYGTAIHAALELAGSEVLRSGKPATEKSILQRFDHQLQRELLAVTDRERRLKRGHDVLRAYFTLQPFASRAIWKTEYKVGYGSQAAFLDDIRLTGRLDRLDWQDNTHKSLQVVDYKTGKPKTRNEILVSTVTAQHNLSEREKALPIEIRGAYQRQLLFYRLLGELDRSMIPPIALGTFDFIEAPFEKEKLIQHTFTLEPSAVKELRLLIQQVMKEIRSLSFLSKIPDFFTTSKTVR